MQLISLLLLIMPLIAGCASDTIPATDPLPTSTTHDRVSRVIDGDTFDVMLESGGSDRVRLLGVDTPETFSSNKLGEYNGIADMTCLDAWGDKATTFATEILADKPIKLITDTFVYERDYYARLLSYIEVNGKDFGVMLLENGYARVYTEEKSSRESDYLVIEEQAKTKRLGLWSCGMSSENITAKPNNLKLDPFGPDRDCGDFHMWADAQSFFEAAGGPDSDPHSLDGNNDGIVCESLM